jgi:hypothetical protein
MKKNVMGKILPSEIVLLTENNGKFMIETINDYKAIACNNLRDAMYQYESIVSKETDKDRMRGLL